MRMLMKWTVGTREASEAIRSGRIADINKTLDELTKPEAQYFCTEGGSRTRPSCGAGRSRRRAYLLVYKQASTDRCQDPLPPMGE